MSIFSRQSRREILKLAGGAAVLGRSAADAQYIPIPRSLGPMGMPGPFRGKVVGIYHSGSLTAEGYQAGPIQQMIRQGMMELTGLPDYAAAWQKFVRPGDIVGVKVNPTGNPALLVSSQPFYLEILNGLLLAGIRQQDIIVFERYSTVLDVIRPWFPAWVTMASASSVYDPVQQDITNYDPAYYAEHPVVLPGQSFADPVARRSHLAQFVTRQVTKVINLSVLKTHQASGVTLSLKNLSHGLANNVNRSHYDVTVNELDTFIPAVAAHLQIRRKTVLNIIDGTRGLFHGGPWGFAEHTWDHRTIYFGSDPVAVDRVGWREIDAKRVAMGLLPVALAPPDPPHFGWNVRKPQHIEVAGGLGLGEWRDGMINFIRTVIG